MQFAMTSKERWRKLNATVKKNCLKKIINKQVESKKETESRSVNVMKYFFF